MSLSKISCFSAISFSFPRMAATSEVFSVDISGMGSGKRMWQLIKFRKKERNNMPRH